MTVQTYDSDRAVSMLGVAGRLLSRMTGNPGWKENVWVNQKWISERRPVKGYGVPAVLQVEIRLDDNCKNGHSTFAITGDIRTASGRGRDDGYLSGGCVHDEIAKVFPELAPLIRWHLTSTDGPMHYIANTVFHAGDRDHNGLRAGESRQIKNGRTGKLAWVLAGIPDYSGKSFDGDESELPSVPVLKWEPMLSVGEGKERNLDAARRTAIWPDATDEQLSAEPAELRAALEARHPRLMAQFRCDMEAAGLFLFPSEYVAPRD